MATLKVKVVPGASRNCIAGKLGDALKVRVSAAAEKGKANAAVVELLAGALGVREAQILLMAGHTQARKTFQIAGIEQAQLDAKLAEFQ